MSTALSLLALVLACAGLGLSLLLLRQNGDTTAAVRKHRRAHAAVEGSPDPIAHPHMPEDPAGPQRPDQRADDDTGELPTVHLPTLEQPAARPAPPQ